MTTAYRSSSTRTTWTPRKPYPGGRPAVLFFPSAGGSSDLFYDPSNATTGPRARLVQRIADLGFPCVVDAMGGANLFGNGTAQTAAGSAYTASQSLVGVAAGPVVCVGISMGLTTACNWARLDNTKCLGIVSAFGLCDLVDAYTNNRGGFQTAIGTAWGVTYPTPLPSNASPLANAGQLGSVPWRGWGPSDDAIVPAATREAFAAALTDGTYTDVGALGHDDDVITAAFDSIVSTIVDLAT